MPTLADIYSAIDSAKRKGSDFVRNPGASLQQMVGLANDRAGALNELTSQAASEGLNYGPKSKQLANQMAEAYNPIGMTTWHGSPHVFERFDPRKIGTGEGNQAYGTGMYVAQAKNVGEEYKKQLGASIEINGKPFYDQKGRKLSSTGDSNIDDLLLAHLGDVDKAIADARSFGEHGAASKLLQMKNSGAIKTSDTGYLYKVDLPDTHIRRMLDWDAPLKDQPSPVRKLAKSLGLDMNNLGGDLLAHVGKDEAGKQILEKAGIRGIKYLDQQSRNTGGWHITPPDQTVRGKWMVKSSDYNSQGMHFDTKAEADKALKSKLGEETRNFVVFDPNHLSILERNNQPIK